MDAGCQGRNSNGGVYENSSICKALSNGTLNLPRTLPLPTLHENHLSSDRESKEIPFLFVADHSFPLTVNIMKPYALRNLDDRNRIFSYRSSRIRCITENIFVILVYIDSAYLHQKCFLIIYTGSYSFTKYTTTKIKRMLHSRWLLRLGR